MMSHLIPLENTGEMTRDEALKLAEELFFPNMRPQVEELKQKETPFVHYTSAEVAKSIIEHKTFWMRKPQTMNDFMEIEWGREALLAAWHGGGHGDRLKEAINAIYPDASELIFKQFDDWSPIFQTQTFMACLSEHDPVTEDVLGRLSMWRAYGGENGVGLVLSHKPFTSESDALGAYTAPVNYVSKADFAEQFGEIIERIVSRPDVLKAMGLDALHSFLHHMLKSAILTTKHPGFHEEREWRVIHTPEDGPNKHLDYSLEVVRGVPQQIVKVPLRDIPDEEVDGVIITGMSGLDPTELIQRIIIGPSEMAWVMRDTFITLLLRAGVENPYDRVVVSDIPVRR